MADFYKRHYEQVAQVIQSIATDADDLDGMRREVMANMFADMFGRDNHAFNRERFLYACKPGANVKSKTAHMAVYR